MNIEEIKEILNNWYKMFDGDLGEDVQKVYDHIDSMHNLLTEVCDLIVNRYLYTDSQADEIRERAEKYLQDTKEKS